MYRLGTTVAALLVLAGATGVALSVGGAHAQDPTLPQPASLRCHIFKIDTESGPTWESMDHTTEIGQWVGAQEAEGWQVDDVDFEVGQKATGYPQGYVQICVRPV